MSLRSFHLLALLVGCVFISPAGVHSQTSPPPIGETSQGGLTVAAELYDVAKELAKPPALAGIEMYVAMLRSGPWCSKQDLPEVQHYCNFPPEGIPSLTYTLIPSDPAAIPWCFRILKCCATEMAAAGGKNTLLMYLAGCYPIPRDF